MHRVNTMKLSTKTILKYIKKKKTLDASHKPNEINNAI